MQPVTDTRARRLSRRAIELRTFQRRLRQAAIDLRGKELVVPACGNGFHLELIAKALRPSRLVGVDASSEQVERARRRGVSAELLVGELAQLATATFDAVFAFGTVTFAALDELARVLRPGGVACIEELACHGDARTALAAVGMVALDDPRPTGGVIRTLVAVRI